MKMSKQQQKQWLLQLKRTEEILRKLQQQKAVLV